MKNTCIRNWLLLGIAGLLIVLSLTPLKDAWVVNRAGISVNRAVVAAAAAAAAAAANQATNAGAPATDATAVWNAYRAGVALPAGAEAELADAMALLEAAAPQEPRTATQAVAIWRVYGAAAALAPSEHAFEVLLRAYNTDSLDRTGGLWLGEVASATQHWEVAKIAYGRVDASNLLISRGDIYLETGEKELAVRQYNLARISLDAATDREPAERVTALYRIGRGFLTGGRPLQAIPVLEDALETAATSSPGAVVEQSLALSLALALAQTLPDPSAATYNQRLLFIRMLVNKATRSDLTGSVCVQAARILLLVGDDDPAVSLLRHALDLDPLLSDAYLLLGGWYESKGMKILPHQIYKEGAKQLPADLSIAVAYAIASYRVLPSYEALPLLEKAAETETNNPYLFAFLGDCYLDLGRATEARTAYEEGLRRAPGAEPLTSRLAAMDETTGDQP